MTTSLDLDGGAPSTARTEAAVLAIPDGWVIDGITRDRLAHQLARAAAHVSGVVAPLVDLAPGASYRVTAERAALAPLSEMVSTAELVTRGAVLVRSGIGFGIGAETVEVARGALLVDRGTTVHDPWRPFATVEAGSPLGRPPFPHRPVILFLGTEPDPDLADWVRRSVNNLIRRDTEARIAVPEPTPGLHLTRPCSPTAATIAALVPDVVVALDEAAVDLGATWLGRRRSPVMIELTPDTTDRIALVPWRIGRARGRLRARIGRGIEAGPLAELVRRLCAGPQPLPPRTTAMSRQQDASPIGGLRRPGAAAREATGPALSVVALVGTPSPVDEARFTGFADHADAAGAHLVVHLGATGVPADAETADLVVVRSLSGAEHVHDLVRSRRRAGRPSIIDVGPLDLDAGASGRNGVARLSPAAASLTEAAGLATTTSTRMRELLRGRGLRAHVLPTLTTTARARELRRLREEHLREEHRPAGPAVVGWHIAALGPVSGDRSAAAVTAIGRLLDDRPELTLAVVGDVGPVVDTLGRRFAGGGRVTVEPGTATAGKVVGWTAQVWTALPLQTDAGDDFRGVVEAHHLGVPTLAFGDIDLAAELAVPVFALESSDDLLAAIERLLEDETERARRSGEAVRLAEALDGPESAVATLNRLFGWIRFGPVP